MIGNKKIMGENIQYYMRQIGVDRKEFAKAIGVPYSSLTDWINGNTYPRIDKEDDSDVSRKLCSFSLAPSVIKKLAELSHSSGLSRSQIVADLINDAYEERKKAEH